MSFGGVWYFVGGGVSGKESRYAMAVERALHISCRWWLDGGGWDGVGDGG